MAANNAIDNTLQSPFNVGATSVTSTGTQLNLLNALTVVPINKVIVQTFTSSGTYTPTSGMKYCTIEVQAPGGGGGGVSASIAAQTSIGTGGGGGGYARKTVSAATVGASQTVTIGAVGTAGANTGGNGGTGGTTSVGAIVSATGGNGGTGGVSAAAAQPLGVPGGVGSGGDFNYTGSTSSVCPTSTVNVFTYPDGGSSYFGGRTVYQAGYGAGVNGIAYGSGGTGALSMSNGGASGAFVGGTGGPGIIIITEYVSA